MNFGVSSKYLHQPANAVYCKQLNLSFEMTCELSAVCMFQNFAFIPMKSRQYIINSSSHARRM